MEEIDGVVVRVDIVGISSGRILNCVMTWSNELMIVMIDLCIV